MMHVLEPRNGALAGAFPRHPGCRNNHSHISTGELAWGALNKGDVVHGGTAVALGVAV